MGHSHSHSHSMDHFVLTNQKGVRALKISFLGLMATAVVQAVIVWFTGSVALLADTVHNFADAFTALPLWVAFYLSRRKPTKTFTYGYSRVEDLVGLLIIFLIFGTAVVIGMESVRKMKIDFVPQHLSWVIGASIIGYIGNEWVARYRIKIGREINSAALVADGQHARADALTSLGVLLGAVGVLLGYPIADPLVGLAIAFAIAKIGWSSGKEMIHRLMDATEPETVQKIIHEAKDVEGVLNVVDVRARNVGQELRADLTIEVDGKLTVLQGHEIAVHVHRHLKEIFPGLVSPNIHVDPEGHRGEDRHLENHG